MGENDNMKQGVRIAYSGIEGSFASICVGKVFPEGIKVPYSSFAKAYEAVENQECDLAVLPIENSFAGEVGKVSDLMFEGSLYVNGVYELKVSQCLVGVKDTSLAEVKTVISHPQALDQCATYIEEHGFEMIPVSNTARAAKKVATMDDPTVAAIASRESASLYQLDVLDYSINESTQNTTRFAVFTRKSDIMEQEDENNTTILMFTVNHVAGSLARAISVIGDYGYNMRTIRSRPMKDKKWQYFFYTEVEGKVTSGKGKEMLKALEKECEILKMVGSYKPE
ncbi:MAG: bifunctional chorismate mutase/prephenate dehydratase [Lachnospiraceae bacterium]|nr:bifunctional chorismate mutase/prephenate dehydratase [Lachnospiraceae bacterium]